MCQKITSAVFFTIFDDLETDELANSELRKIELQNSFQIGGNGSKGIDHGVCGKGGLGLVPVYGHTYLKTEIPVPAFFGHS